MLRRLSFLRCLIVLLFCFQLCDGEKRLLVNDDDYVEAKLKNLESSLRQEFSAKMSTYEGKLRAMNSTISILQSAAHQHVAFYATLSAHRDLGELQTIEFDIVKTNIGNAYNSISGVFTVPRDGLYQFSSTTFSATTNTLHTQIMLNTTEVGRNYGNSHGASSTMNIVISAKKGDVVYVRHMATLAGQKVHGGGYSSFSGFLLE